MTDNEFMMVIACVKIQEIVMKKIGDSLTLDQDCQQIAKSVPIAKIDVPDSAERVITYGDERAKKNFEHECAFAAMMIIDFYEEQLKKSGCDAIRVYSIAKISIIPDAPIARHESSGETWQLCLVETSYVDPCVDPVTEEFLEAISQ